MNPRALLLLCLLLASPLAAKPPDAKTQLIAYLKRGCPPPQRIWNGMDYGAARKMIENGTLPLPRSGDPVLSPILKRMINPQNIEALVEAPGEAELKFRLANRIGYNLAPLIALYQKAAHGSAPVQSEIAGLTALLLRVAAVSFSYAPDADSEKLRAGLMKMIDGVIVQMERGDWSEPNDLPLARSLSEALPIVRSALPIETLQDYRARLEKCRSHAQSPELKDELGKAIDATESSVRLNT